MMEGAGRENSTESVKKTKESYALRKGSIFSFSRLLLYFPSTSATLSSVSVTIIRTMVYNCFIISEGIPKSIINVTFKVDEFVHKHIQIF